MISADRIEQRMSDLGLNPFSAAKKAGLGADYVRDLLRGKVKQPSAAKLHLLAQVLECSPEYLMGIGSEPGERPYTYDDSEGAGPVKLPVAFEVKPGFFEIKSQDNRPHRTDDSDAHWVLSADPDGDEWLEILRENYHDLLSAGTILHVVEGDKYQSWLGPYVVVERTRDGGTLVERSVRRLRTSSNGSVSFFEGPWDRGNRSLESLKAGTDPEYGKIVGVVVRAYRFFMTAATVDGIPF